MNEPATEVESEKRAGEEAETFRAIYPRARRFAAFIAPAGVEPDDVVQEALARVLSRTTLHELAEPLAYLRMAMLNIVRNEHRRLGRERAAFNRIRPVATVDDQAAQIVTADEVIASLATLSAKSRALVFLVDLEDQPIAEAARVVGVSAPAARRSLSRARGALRRTLDPSEEDAP